MKDAVRAPESHLKLRSRIRKQYGLSFTLEMMSPARVVGTRGEVARNILLKLQFRFNVRYSSFGTPMTCEI